MKTLILMDIQNDFLEGGAAPVAKATSLLPVANALQDRFERIVATVDWHPPNHLSFAPNHPGRKPGDIIDVSGQPQVLMPPHCLKGTRGAAFADNLSTRSIHDVFRKGLDPESDGYSAFWDHCNKKNSTGLERNLKKHGVKHLYLAGLSHRRALRRTALDAIACGFKTSVILDACAGVDPEADDYSRWVKDLRKAGVRVVRSSQLL